MKNLKYIFIIFLIGVMQSCDWLDLTPVDNYSIDNYWQSKDQVDRFIRGLHVRVRNAQFTFFKMGELRGGTFDNNITSPFAQTKSDLSIVGNNMSEANYGIGNFGNFYMDIMQINHAIKEIPGVTFLSEEEKNYDLGIVYGLRAFYYFHLFRTYGGVPLVDYPKVLEGISSPVVLNKERATEEATYAFIVNDVKTSESYFKNDKFTVNSTDKSSFWGKAATEVLKAEVLLWGCKVKPIGGSAVYSSNKTQDLNDAKIALQSVVNSTKYGYLDDFSKVFATDNKNNKEMIFCLHFMLNEATNAFGGFLYPEANGNANGWENRDGTERYGDNAPADPLSLANSGSKYLYQYDFSLFNLFDNDDTRRDASLIDLYQTGKRDVKVLLLAKFLGEFDDSHYRRFTNDWPVYRYMDVLLLLAEVENELGGDPAPYINDVRRRAYGDKFEAHKYPQPGEVAEDAILEERTKEFVAEGKRWYDLRRMKGGELAKALQVSTKPDLVEKHLLWPIDANTLSDDPLVEQTPGY